MRYYTYTIVPVSRFFDVHEQDESKNIRGTGHEGMNTWKRKKQVLEKSSGTSQKF